MKRSIFNIVLVLTLGAISCVDQDPRPLLKHDQEVVRNVMVDLYIAEQALKNLSEENKDSLRPIYTSQIEKIHEVSIVEIEKDIELIKSNPKWNLEFQKGVRDSVAILTKRMETKLNEGDDDNLKNEMKKTTAVQK